jgi:hypothetical protein
MDPHFRRVLDLMRAGLGEPHALAPEGHGNPETRGRWRCAEGLVELHERDGIPVLAYRPDKPTLNLLRGFTEVRTEAQAECLLTNLREHLGCAG